jgi:hypothetical protein
MTDKKPSGTHPVVRDMSAEDWTQLIRYVQSANQVRALIAESIGSGKQQISIQRPSVQEFLEVGSKVDPAFWFKLGMICGEQSKSAE